MNDERKINELQIKTWGEGHQEVIIPHDKAKHFDELYWKPDESKWRNDNPGDSIRGFYDSVKLVFGTVGLLLFIWFLFLYVFPILFFSNK